METSEFNPVIKPMFNTTDRSAIMILPKEIYYQWRNCVIENKDLQNHFEPEVFLMPGFKMLEQAESFVRNFYDLFFQYELRKWAADPSFWPVNRTFALFMQWFEIRVSYSVSDILAQPIIKETENLIFDEPNDRDFFELEDCDILESGWWCDDFHDPYDPFFLPKPGLCLTCCKEYGEEDYLCEMFRMDQNENDEFALKSPPSDPPAFSTP